ncbi:MAG: TIM-barrel domain-containing protein [[Clostridium] leptum]
MILTRDNLLIYRYRNETVHVEPWGANAVRVRATKNPAFPENDWALASRPSAQAEITVSPEGAVLTNGKIRLSLSNNGKITVYNQKDERILEEDTRKFCALKIEAREFRPIPGGDYHLTARFQSLDPNERIYGMGQYQQPYLNLKGTDLELAHRNSQASVPFMISSLGYGLLWNNPAVGRAVFGKNVTSFEAFSTQALDYWIVAGDTPAELIEAYGSVAGTVPMMPEYGLGFWQCKLRYQIQEELLHVAREYKRQGLPIDVIVIDFFHWPHQGDWKFDPAYWPDPKAMIEELKSMGIQLMVSIWPTVETDSENYEEMLENGYLIRCDRGVDTSFIFLDKNTLPFDATNPEARGYVWAKVKEHYYDAGVRLFWLDEAEPEYNIYDFDNYRYYSGPCLQTGNIYPSCYSQAFYDGMKAAGQTNIVNLVRCAWAGSQKYGALVWSGDIPSTFGSMKNQLAAGLNMGIAGIPWWTTDIGGFYGGDPTNPEFQELFIRWFQWGAFCPVMRLHGDREPRQPQYGTTGGYFCASGADNEVWSYGPEAFEICKKYLRLREEMRDYTRKLMEEAHTKGLPLMRAMFVEFPDDPVCWELEEQYMYGDKYLVAPILNLGQRARKVYLPSGCDWRLSDGSQQIFSGGQWTEVRAPLDTMPVFERVRR